MYYSFAVLPALAALAQAMPQAVNAKAGPQGPVKITNIPAEASRVMKIMYQQYPTTIRTKPVTVTGKPATVNATRAPKPKTTKVKKHKRAAATTTPPAGAVKAASSSATTTTSTTTTTIQTNVNSACGVQPTFQPYYPAGNASDPQVFLKDSTINTVSTNAGNVNGFTWMWSGYMMQTQTRGFLGVYQLPTYNVSACAAYCNSVNYCNGFNIFYERDPSLQPASGCPNPAPIASIRCTLWDDRIDIYSATNYGQWRAAFPVVVAGSNGYSRI